MKKIRIFSAPWHAGHQWELFKLPNTQWTFLINNVRRWHDDKKRPYEPASRPEPPVEWVTYYEKGKYDLAILDIDQQCISADIAGGKKQLYEHINKVISDIPKIVINHGTPYWPEYFTKEQIINGGTVMMRGKPKYISGIKKMVGSNYMISNSKQARDAWGWGDYIIHGLDPDEWWDLTKEPRVITVLSPAGLDKYYNRELLMRLKGILRDEYAITHVQIGLDFKSKSFDDYRYILGTSLLYLNCTFDSPMPRSRTEAMLSGACILTTPYHGGDWVVEGGKSGFIIGNDPYKIAALINELIENRYQQAIKIGQRGKERAKKILSKERFQQDWQKVFDKVLGGKK